MKYGATISILLLSPVAAFADPKSDIVAYEAAYDKGADNANSLLKLAFDNCVVNPNKDAYCGKIGYDYASLLLVSKNTKEALAPISMTKAILESSPELASGSDMNEIKLIHNLAILANHKNDNYPQKIINSLNENTKALAGKSRDDSFVNDANILICDYYIRNQNWKELGTCGDNLMKSSKDYLNKEPNYQKDAEVAAYLYRGIAKFASDVNKQRNTNFETASQSKLANWADAIIDFSIADNIYGKERKKDDITKIQIWAWKNLTDAFALSRYSKKDNENTFKIIDSELMRIGGFTSKYNNSDKENCKNVLKVANNGSYPNSMVNKYSFASAIIRFDFDKNEEKIKNPRILASIPDASFGQNALNAIKNAKIEYYDKNADEKCFIGYTRHINYVVN
jgi:hypothetical protein